MYPYQDDDPESGHRDPATAPIRAIPAGDSLPPASYPGMLEDNAPYPGPISANGPTAMPRNGALWVYLYGGALGAVAFLVSFTWPPHNVWLHLGLSCLIALCYGWLVSGGVKENAVDRTNFLAGEQLKVRTRRHKVAILAGLALMFVGLVGLVYTLYAYLSDVTYHGFRLQYPALVVSALFVLVGATVVERWRCLWWDITDRRWIVRREQSPWLPFITRDVDPEQLNQVVDVNYRVSLWGSKFHWGTITLELRRQGEVVTPQSVRKVKMRLVPNVIQVYNTIRDGSPITNPRPVANPRPGRADTSGS